MAFADFKYARIIKYAVQGVFHEVILGHHSKE